MVVPIPRNKQYGERTKFKGFQEFNQGIRSQRSRKRINIAIRQAGNDLRWRSWYYDLESINIRKDNRV